MSAMSAAISVIASRCARALVDVFVTERLSARCLYRREESPRVHTARLCCLCVCDHSHSLCVSESMSCFFPGRKECALLRHDYVANCALARRCRIAAWCATTYHRALGMHRRLRTRQHHRQMRVTHFWPLHPNNPSPTGCRSRCGDVEIKQGQLDSLTLGAAFSARLRLAASLSHHCIERQRRLVPAGDVDAFRDAR